MWVLLQATSNIIRYNQHHHTAIKYVLIDIKKW